VSPVKIPAVVLGATGTVGQRIVQLLATHPWFELAAVAASEGSAGRRYDEACRWALPGEPPETAATLLVDRLDPEAIDGRRPAIAFSALPSDVAREVEPRFAEAGFAVCSNASAFRETPDVPLVIPEVNPGHLALLETQRAKRGWDGLLVTNPNCAAIGIVLAIAALDRAFGLRAAAVTTLQAISGAGYPGVPSLDILGNTIPWIPNEEAKIESETQLLLGRVADGVRIPSDATISAQVNRVPVVDGHTFCLSLGFDRTPEPAEAAAVLRAFRGGEAVRALPSAPGQPVRVTDAIDRPQPRLDLLEGGGMAVTVGRIRPCPILDLRAVGLIHNTLRGAAGAAVLNAELLVAEGWIS
jgi:aspartate-semialdehyde dehydrogenase